ncbi:MAG: methyltransferase regulatory domain-containing protein [Chromatiales bacterium]|nr:methyltransferase regulatory domain-containing protein [Chromatiales bacterium]
MSDRSAGYVTDVGYTFGYHAALNPLASRLAFLRAGLEPPRIATACELGFGQGVSLAVHAAASPVHWWGNDLLPEHVRFAQSLDTASGAGSVLVEATFEEFAKRTPDLPRFDFIGLHGVLSWISAGNRVCIADFIRDRLAPGGVVYTGYNALPGWADMVPLRRLLTEHAARAGTGSTVSRIDAALDFAARLLDTHPLAIRSTPGVPARFERLRHADRRYLAHEYFNRDWDPLYFADVAGLFATAGLHYACPAQLRDHLDALNLTDGQRGLLAETGDAVFRETVRDFVTNAQVRRDYWIRDAEPLAGEALREAWRGTRVVLTTPRGDVAERVTGPLGELRLADPAHRAVLAALGDHRPRTVAEVHATAMGFQVDELANAVFELAAAGQVALAQDDAAIGRRAPHTGRLNAQLLAQAATSDDVAVLASPVTGGGVAVDRIEQLFLGAMTAGGSAPEELAAHALGRATPWDEAELVARARRFAERRLPVLRALGIAR